MELRPHVRPHVRRRTPLRTVRGIALGLCLVLAGGLIALLTPQPPQRAAATGQPPGPTTTAPTAPTAVTTAGTVLPVVPLADAIEGYVLRRFHWQRWIRGYRYHLPAGRQPAAPAPLIVVLHGYLLDAQWAEHTTRFDEVGDASGAVVVYPQGLAKSWNAGGCCAQAAAVGVDDADFVRGVVDDIAGRMPIDRRRVMLVGYSNGGMLAYQIACQTPQQVASLVVVNASRQVDACTPPGPVSVLAVHSRGDRTLPFDGSRLNRRLHVATRGVEESLEPLVEADGCAQVRVDQEGIWESRMWRDCRQGSELTLLVHPTLDHRWPKDLPAGRTVGSLAWERFGGRVALEGFAGGRTPITD